MTSLETAWLEFKKECVHPSIQGDVLIVMKLAFYAGSRFMYNVGTSKGITQKHLEAVRREMLKFDKELGT
jgi:hypothetical protein